MAKKVKIGIVGTGGIARHHANLLKKIGDNEIVAGCDIKPDVLKDYAETYGVAKTFEDYNDLVKLKELDAVSVCTPNGVHMPPAVAALKAGKHVICEKPLAMNASECRKMVKAAKEAGKLLVIGFQQRFSPNSQTIKRAIDEGILGKILYVRAKALRRRGIPSWGVFGQKELNGGGPLIDIGVHTLECCHYLIGKPKPIAASGQCYTYIGNKKPQAICGWGEWDYKTYNVEDLAVGFIRFENGATLFLESSFAAHIEKDSGEITIMGTKGGATVDPPQIYTDTAGAMYNMSPQFCGKQDCFEYKLSHFLDCVRTGKKSQAPGEDGLMVQQMLDGIYKSSELGKEIRIR